jgi:DNA repair photolyase
VITKSTLVLRDLDLLTALGKAAGVGVVLSIPFADDAMARLVEPFAAPPSLRFKALEKLSAAGLRTGVSLGPIIPGLNDSDIPALLARAKAAGAAFAFYVMLRLPGATREVFLERMRERLPERARKIEHHVREVRGGELYETKWGARMSGTGTMAEMVDNLFRIHARKHGLEAGESMERLEMPARDRDVIEFRSGKDMRKPASPPAKPAGAGKSGAADAGQLDLFSA